MTKTEFILEVSKKSGISRKDAERAVNSAIAIVSDLARNGEELRIPRFGTFRVVMRNARVARNPKTGQPVKVPPKKALKFVPSLELRSL
ncbi:HU family DNA-binding protein [Thermodesulfovibrio thiophilus]|uniref:HU family DNA-binding protein n=1 Tax=Thermodesulfovibrio thiophilus TaxID=340095 RepID=UPI000409CEFF|nr:HU family DNA-binding protein [Thermodesulfovibrio thiophilus]